MPSERFDVGVPVFAFAKVGLDLDDMIRRFEAGLGVPSVRARLETDSSSASISRPRAFAFSVQGEFSLPAAARRKSPA